MREEEDFFGGALKIALGIFIGGLCLWIAFELRARYELHLAAEALSEMTRPMQEAAERDAANALALKREREEGSSAAEYARRAAQDARTARDFEAAQKERAWRAYFHPSSACAVTVSVECGNEHIRARRDFDRRYAAGELHLEQ
ncbi:MAG TPA: hypothetical protein VGN07_14945 [Steroidobacteraceae bacterium]|jgi:hypothetical protein